MAANAPPVVSTKKPTITLSFAEPEDAALYERIIAAAKADRRSPSQYALLQLQEHFGPSESN